MARFVLYRDRVFERYGILGDLGINVSYSWKTNPDVGRVLMEKKDCWFSVHNVNELKKVRAGNAWYFVLGDNYLDAFDYGARNFVIELEEDLRNLLKHANGEKINVLLRMKLQENTIFTGKQYVFGIESKRICELIDELSGDARIGKLGIHFHRKTQNYSEWNIISELEDSIGSVLNKIEILNIGGGLPGKYKNTNDSAVEMIFERIREIRKWFKRELWIEPGRFIAAHSIDLECNVVARDGETVFVDCSIFNGMMDTVVANIKLLVEGEVELREGKRYLIKGVSPDSSDILRYEVFLDRDLNIGDKLVFLNAGAYNYSTDFNDLAKIETVVV